MLTFDPQMTFTELFDPQNHLSADRCHHRKKVTDRVFNKICFSEIPIRAHVNFGPQNDPVI